MYINMTIFNGFPKIQQPKSFSWPHPRFVCYDYGAIEVFKLAQNDCTTSFDKLK